MSVIGAASPALAGERQADAIRLPMSFDPILLAADLDRLSAGDWTEHFIRQNYEGDWSVLPLRAPAGATHPIQRITAFPWTTEWVDTELLTSSPYLQHVLAAFPTQVESARLMRLGAGSTIREHSDPDLDEPGGTVRLHVPIRTNENVDFQISRRRIVMASGSVWYLRLSNPHRVANRGVTDRVHLVFDVKLNDWMIEQIAAGVPV